MHDGVDPGVDEDAGPYNLKKMQQLTKKVLLIQQASPSNIHLVEVDVVVEGQDGPGSGVAKLGHGVPQQGQLIILDPLSFWTHTSVKKCD